MRGPCNWPELPACTCATSCLDSANPTQLTAAIDYSQTVLWAATGRRFGLCDLTVRPCGVRQGQCTPGASLGNFFWGGLWWPFIGADGLWRNCGCRGFCRCRPRCEAFLLGPVNSITQVVVDGLVVDPSTYEVHDRQFLVRTGGECWPECPDMAASEEFEVSYVLGEPVPSVLLVAARVLACEFLKACRGEPCRLPGRMSNLFRQGVQVQFVDIDRLTDKGWTGVQEVDQILAVLNPHAIRNRPRVYTPDRPFPRVVTTPTGS